MGEGIRHYTGKQLQMVVSTTMATAGQPRAALVQAVYFISFPRAAVTNDHQLQTGEM